MKVLFLNSINATMTKEGGCVSFINATYPTGVNLDDIPPTAFGEIFSRITSEETQQVWDTFQQDLTPALRARHLPAKAKLADESFIQSIEDGQNTGGHIFNDIITLKNGMIIQISEESVCIYRNEEKQDQGNWMCACSMEG